MHLFALVIAAIHLCSSVLAAPPQGSLSSRPAVSLLNDPAPNASPPRNLTFSSALHLPSDPSYYPIPSSDEQLKLFSYGSALRRRSALSIIQAAKRDITFNVKKGSQMGTAPLHYESGDIHMVIHVTRGMTWEVMGAMVRGLQSWFEEWEWVECDFDMGQIGHDTMFGIGAVVQFDKGVQ